MIECWHFWGCKTGNSLKATEQPGRETPAAVKESAGPRWLWNGSLLRSGGRSRSANPGYSEAPEPPCSLYWLKIIHLGLRLTSVLRREGRGCFRHNVRHWFWHAWYCNKLIWERNSHEMQPNKTAICKQFMTASNHYGEVRSTFTGGPDLLDRKVSGCSQFLLLYQDSCCRKSAERISSLFPGNGLFKECIWANGGGETRPSFFLLQFFLEPLYHISAQLPSGGEALASKMFSFYDARQRFTVGFVSADGMDVDRNVLMELSSCFLLIWSGFTRSIVTADPAPACHI